MAVLLQHELRQAGRIASMLGALLSRTALLVMNRAGLQPWRRPLTWRGDKIMWICGVIQSSPIIHFAASVALLRAHLYATLPLTLPSLPWLARLPSSTA